MIEVTLAATVVGIAAVRAVFSTNWNPITLLQLRYAGPDEKLHQVRIDLDKGMIIDRPSGVTDSTWVALRNMAPEIAEEISEKYLAAVR